MRMEVFCKIHPAVKEFIRCTNGSDLIVPRKDDWLWLLLKQNLCLIPEDYKPVSPEEREQSYIRISLLDASGSKVQVRKKSPVRLKRKEFDPSCVYMNTLFRSYLDEKGQRIIANHLRTQFKECFHNFCQGALALSPDMEQKQVIIEFCRVYNITLNHISEDMLVKSWQRSVQKQVIRNRMLGHHSESITPGCPIIF